MRHLLNTLYVTTPDAYLALDGETITIKQGDELLRRLPLMNFESIVKFGHLGVSPALLGYCAERNIPVCFLSRSGRFLARVTGEYKGNVTLRKQQYRLSDDETACLPIARNLLTGKLYNARSVLERALRDHELRVDGELLRQKSGYLRAELQELKNAPNLEILRGIEGRAAADYFAAFDELILQQKDAFHFAGRTRRPPLDKVNAMLSFLYILLAHDCASALETVGLDPYVGFLHRDRPGRASLALDLMEELRSFMVERLVISLINRKEVSPSDFIIKVDRAVTMADEGRKIILTAWQNAKKETITHPFLGEKIAWGLVPYVQAQLLARFIRGDLDQYPPFLWK